MMRILRLFLCAACLPLAASAQPNFITSLYPAQHALNVPADAELRVGLQAPLDPTSLSDSSIYVWSDITGLHKLTVTLENDNKDLRIVPRHWRLNDRPPFNAGERVTVTLTTRLRYADGRPFEGFTWHYTVAVRRNHGGTFSPLVQFGGGYSTYYYVSDFNGDGWCDLIGNDDGIERKMIVFLNDQTGKFTFNGITTIVPGRGEVTDFDKDGDQDIFFGFQQVILNDGAGNLTQKDYPGWPNGQGRAHDFNNDGLTDYVIAYVLSDTVYFSLSKNGEPFKKLQKLTAPIRRPLLYFYGISYDLTNDGRIDFLYFGGSVVEKIDPGFASFQATAGDSLRVLQVFKDNPYGSGEFYGNDLDGDGDIDYAFATGDGANNYIATFMNDGSGQLGLAGLLKDNPEIVEGGDFDGDGDIDLAYARSNMVSVIPERYAPDFSILLNDGQGNFSLTQRVRLPFDRPLSRGMLRAVDFDRDGDLDLIGIANGLFYVVANGSFATAVIQPDNSTLPLQFSIVPIYPNPVKNEAEIVLKIPENRNEEITVTIFDVTGRRIRSWHFNGRRRLIHLTWDAHDQNANPVPNGVYFVHAQIGKLTTGQKFLVLK